MRGLQLLNDPNINYDLSEEVAMTEEDYYDMTHFGDENDPAWDRYDDDDDYSIYDADDCRYGHYDYEEYE